MSQNQIYTPRLPQNLTPEQVPQFLYEELNRLATEINQIQQGIVLDELNVAPSRPVAGLTVRADGTNWNPGSGQGVYTYYGGAWNKLG